MTTLDGVVRRLLAQNDGIVMVDTGAGRLGNFWQMAFLCNTLLVPTSMSWADLRPTIDFIKEIDERKVDLQSVTPHVVVVPNRVSPQQRHFQQISDALLEVNAILAPPISELSAARKSSSDFSGLEGVEGTRFYREIERLGEFLVDYVISGELDRIYAETAN
jgi:chromosome partitioning protein